MLVLALPVAVVFACGDDERDAVEVTPVEPKPSVPELPTDVSIGEDASAPATPIGASFDAGADADAIDAATEEPCPPVGTTPSTGARYAFAVASRPSVPKVLDGDLADFRRCVAIRLDSASAARTYGTTVTNANVYLEWEPGALWIGAEIGDVVTEGDDAERPFFNDSIEIYLSGAGLRTGDYGPLDHQFVIDHAGRAREYASGREVGPFGAAVAAKTPTGYRIEMRIDASTFSTAALTKGDVKFFNVLLNDGVRQPAWLLWAMQPHASCACTACACNTMPAMDTLLFAPITLR